MKDDVGATRGGTRARVSWGARALRPQRGVKDTNVAHQTPRVALFTSR
jgi:hypothetical protein